jgi:hypothetical protein
MSKKPRNKAVWFVNDPKSGINNRSDLYSRRTRVRLYGDGRDGSPACEFAVVAAIGLAEKILEMIDSKYP